MKKNRILLPIALILLLILPFQNGLSQSYSDQEGWTAVELDVDVVKNLSLSISEHWRLRNDITTTKNYFTEFNVDYEILNNLDIGGGVRYITKNDDVGGIQGLESHFRYQLETSYKYKIKAITTSFRIRYQNKNQLGLTEEEGDVHKEHLRLRLGLGYTIKPIKLEVKATAETFNEFKSTISEGGYNRNRYVLKLSKEFKKIGKFDLFYGIQEDTELDNNNNEIDIKTTILGFKYSYRIKI